MAALARAGCAARARPQLVSAGSARGRRRLRRGDGGGRGLGRGAHAMRLWLAPVVALVIAGLWLRGRWLRSISADPLITRGRRALRDAVARFVAARLGGYRQPLNQPDARLPLSYTPTGNAAPSVAVIGAGLAGLGAACDLAA